MPSPPSSPPRWSRLSWTVSALLLGVLIAWILRENVFRADVAVSLQQRAPFPLEADASSLEMGELWIDDAHERAVPVRNVSDAPVHVAAVSTSCRCTEATSSTFDVPPGGEHLVKLNVKLEGGG